MVTKTSFNVEELVRDDRVHGRMYTDPEIFERELEKIWGRTWVYVAHESEIAQPGDYKATYIGLQPVIVTRDADDGRIHVLYNRCRHRAATVCQEETGTAHYFRCAYHGWTYNNRGELIGVPYRQGYGEGFTYAEYGLVRVPRVASYRGFIFASLSPEGISLEEHLRNARPYIDRFVDASPEGEIVVKSGVHKYGVNANWKLQIENSADNYHVAVVHQSVREITARRLAASGKGKEGMYGFTEQRFVDSRVRDLGYGQTVNDRRVGSDLAAIFRATQDGRRYLTALEERFGPEAAAEMINRCGAAPFTFTIFPNLVILFSTIRVLRPIAVDRTEVYVYPTLLKGVPEEINAIRLREHEHQFGPAGFIGPDDAEVLARVQAGLKAKGDEWVLQAREFGREEVDEWGIRSGHIIGETGLRAIAREWKRLMAAP